MTMKITKSEFVKSGTKPSQFPPPDRPEIAFGGRSNVGKSSLINSLLNRTRLVKTSKTPGATQLVNFFNINDTLYLVDLPGYGYAKVPISLRDAWGPMVETYLGSRPNLRAIVILMDIRRGPMPDDMKMIEACPHFGIQPIMVFTKADKFGKNARMERRRQIAEELRTPPEELILYSSTKNFGQDELWDRICQITGL